MSDELWLKTHNLWEASLPSVQDGCKIIFELTMEEAQALKRMAQAQLQAEKKRARSE